MTIQEMFPDGEWKSDVEYLIKCPYCGDPPIGHNHCYINVYKEKFYCQYCGEAGTTFRLSYDFGDGETIERDDSEHPTKVRRQVDIEQFQKVTGMSSTLDRMALTYLKERGMNKHEIELYDVRFSSYGRFYGRVLFPMYEDGKFVCISGRTILKNVKPPWLFAHKGETILTTSESFYCFDFIKPLKPENIVLVEGVFDAIRLNRCFGEDPNLFKGLSLALMGKKLSDIQLNKLLNLPKNTQFYVMLDAEARKSEIIVAQKLKMYGRNVKVCQLTDIEGEPDDLDCTWQIYNVLDEAYEMDLNLEIRTLLDE